MNENKTELLGTPIESENDNDGFRTARMCYVHLNRAATRNLKIPCAPKGGLDACDECAHPDSRALFDKYQASHAKNIKAFTQRNPNS